MIIIIPLGGKGIRFKLNNYDLPKGLIKVENKEIICWLLDNIINNNNLIDNDFIYIPYNYEEYKNYNLEKLLINRYSNIKFKFYKLMNDTKGAAHTINIALNELIKEKIDDTSIISLDVDNFYTNNIIDIWNRNNMIFTFNDYLCENNFSYILKDNDTNIIKKIKEKELFDNLNENLACCGAYGFESFYNLHSYSSTILEKEEYEYNKEYYISSIIQIMINNSIDFYNNTIDNKYYFSLGTPEQIEKFNYIILFDLDGTLVETDNIYINVWNILLNEYNIYINDIFFNKNIKGKSDELFLKSLFPGITKEEIKEFSKKKDNLFLDNLENIKIYDGAIDFIQKLQNNRLAIVTSCNKIAATSILKLFNLDKYINLLISSNDIEFHKPHPEPYLKAISKLSNNDINDNNNDNIIVFEDSISGYMSAVNANIKNIFFKINNNYDIELPKCKIFNNYNELLFKKNILNNNSDIEIIKNCITIPFKYIENTCDILKDGGYICNVYSYKVQLNNYNELNIIIKKSNNNNNLTEVAKKLNLFFNEKYFYDNIADKLNYLLKIPKCYGTYNDNYNTSIILENLNLKTGCFNINLNNNIDLLLKVVENISKMHMKYVYTKKEDNKDINIRKLNEILYYNDLIQNKYLLFKSSNIKILKDENIQILDFIYNNFNKIINHLSNYPLNLCHGDLKSPNIFYENYNQPYFLDWQYFHLNKGVSDIIFLLIESIDFNKEITDIIIKYYYTLLIQNNISYKYDDYIIDLQASLCSFPFFVCVWFNTEDIKTLNDKNFPLRFMLNYIKYLEYFLNDNKLLTIL